jgi:peptidoglycan/LPS O-acetylase OafA/YrhL
MHALATSYQPVAGDEDDNANLDGESRPAPRSNLFTKYLPSIQLDGEKHWWRTFTEMVFGWPMPPHDPSRETAWLDGLRGMAAFLVMSYHFNLNWYFPALVEEPWGANLKEHGWDLWRMPFLRLWMCSGHTQVSIFFVLSGFVLSWSPLNSIRNKNYDKLYKGLGSSAFRRWIRLYLPTVPIAFWECLELYFGYREIGSKTRESNFFLQLWDFIKSCEQYANPLDFNRNQWSSLHPYDWTMWTIPYEFAGSLLVFFILLAVGRIHNYTRRTIAISIIVAYCAARAEWSFWLFSNGVLIADYVREHGGFQALSDKQTTKSLIGWSALLVVALWIGGVPAPFTSLYTRPGYDWLDSITPKNWMEVEGGGRLWWNIAGILIIFSSCHLSGIRRLFEHGAVRYLGRISYMMYLTHRIVLEPALRPFRDWIMPVFGRDGFIDMPQDNGSPYHWLITILLYCTLWLVIGPTAILVAHWCERLFDAPSVRFAKYVDERFMGGFTKRDASEGLTQPALPTHNDRGAGGGGRANGAAPPAPAPYRDDEPDMVAPHAAGKEEEEETKENVELVDLPPRAEDANAGAQQQRSLV